MYSLVIFLVVFLIFVYSCISDGKEVREKAVFSKEYSMSLKGMLSIIIVIHHYSLSSLFDESVLQTFYRMIGYPCVAVFFFISGYGIAYSFKNKENYGQRFVKDKIWNIVLPYMVSTCVYFTARVAWGGGKNEIRIIVDDMKRGLPVSANSWYIVVILILYLFYFFSYKLREPFYHICVGLFCIIYFFIMKDFLKWPTNWFGTFFCFFIGVDFLKLSNKFECSKRRRCMLFLGFLSSFSFTLIYQNTEAWLYFEILGSVCIVLFSYFISTIIAFKNNSLLEKIGKYSLYIYLYHGLAIQVINKLFPSKWIYLNCFLVVFFSVIGGKCIYTLHNKIQKIMSIHGVNSK